MDSTPYAAGRIGPRALLITAAAVPLAGPPDCPDPERNRYLIYVARRHGVPVCATLTATARTPPSLSSPATTDPAAPAGHHGRNP